ncbi:cathepsin L1-like [Pecten maximus]|uniref:cathepsin L1-like n=1 Tax=Pecten maximus TaxID=6579 RepID=UPI00145857CE|nr:cathepsin L1-like [Pecten maximus]
MAETSAKVILVFIIVTVVRANYIDVAREWREWKQRHGKVYNNQSEETERRHAWERSFYYVRHHSNRPGHSSFTVGMNSRADMLPRDYRLEVNVVAPDITNNVHNNPLLFEPTSFDWRTRGVIAPVSNQGQIGSSLAIVATECLVSSEAIKTGRLVSLSEREVSDCCGGGGGHRVTDVFSCIHNIGGVCSQTTYPNRPGPSRCRNDSCPAVVKVQGSVNIPSGREDLLQQHLLDQPIMAVIDASHASFQMYKSGIYNEKDCSSTQLDHVVQIVGYGVEQGNEFWIVKNSWGVNWGMNGYILMSRDKNNQCGIASAASYPILG